MPITKVVMPKLSEAMESGKVIKWIKKEGDRVEGGEIIAEIETDKADIELEAFGSGVLRKIVVPAGDRAPVGGLIAVIADAADDIAGLLAGAPAPPAAAAPPPPVSPAPPPRVVAPPPPPRPIAPAPAPVPVAVPGGRVKASPLAKKVAARSGVDLRLVQGSGPGGRIVRRDVEAALTAAPSPTPQAVPLAPGVEYQDVPLSSIRAAIARRMPLAKAPVPHFYVTVEIAMDRAWELREALNALEGQPKISVTDMIVKACVLALTRHPEVNASFQGESIRVNYRVHMGLAVALDEGLITPVLRNCEAKSLAQIAVEGRDLVERARARKLRAPELSGATFSVSNLGMFDVDEFSAIINPPEGAILAVGAVKVVPVVEEGRIGMGRRMKVTLSCDHRVMDGAMGARFLQTLKQLLEEPLRLLV
ncbi:MAG: dihydrolipoyllysine-residue acetyltransferase component of pyruvate dehydrogenase complex [Candidatus Rokubacteria bacterium CSP1-6]|nr:MAG: dihydrolipoyllysine-residue acetyltransferase component of pyruvate dehydrogenase complex [Candidatus Rokubacteria bacterium CSP1-6]